MGEKIVTIDGRTNPAYLALEALERIVDSRNGLAISEDSFHYVATQIPDFSEDEPDYEIRSMSDLKKYAIDHGFVIEDIGGVLQAEPSLMRDESVLSPDSDAVVLDGFLTRWRRRRMTAESRLFSACCVQPFLNSLHGANCTFTSSRRLASPAKFRASKGKEISAFMTAPRWSGVRAC